MLLIDHVQCSFMPWQKRCFDVVSEGTLKSTLFGEYYGLSIIIDSLQSEYLYGKSRGAGFRVLLHDSNEYPLVDVRGVRLSPGFVTSLAIGLTDVSLLYVCCVTSLCAHERLV